jgi:hypothetical protein
MIIVPQQKAQSQSCGPVHLPQMTKQTPKRNAATNQNKMLQQIATKYCNKSRQNVATNQYKMFQQIRTKCSNKLVQNIQSKIGDKLVSQLST